MNLTRRDFLSTLPAFGAASLAGAAPLGSPAAKPESVAFFLIGDTHYLANRENPKNLADASRTVTARLVDWLNRLPGTKLPEAAGGGTIAQPRGVIHAGDVIDSGDKNGAAFVAMQETEWRGFTADFGLDGRDGRLRWPVYEIHGNHDSPSGKGLVIDGIRQRNRRRPGLVHVSPNGLHYSWDWGPVHFINLGIVVGADPDVKRRRRYAPLDSLPFLMDDLNRLRDRGRPVILTHHIDVARYSGECDPKAEYRNQEWDSCDVRAYHRAVREHNIVGVLYGHTHVRNVFRWNGSPKPAKEGIPVLNTDNVSHFNSKTQAFFYCEVTDREFVAREFATTDSWETGRWNASVWRFPVGGK